MGVNAIPISTATQMASIVARQPSSAPSGFSGTLATSMSSSTPEPAPSLSSATTATSAVKTGEKVDAKTDAKSGAKSGAKTDAKPSVASAPILDANINSNFSPNPVSAQCVAAFEKSGFPVLAPPLTDSSSNQQPLHAPLGANLASVAAPPLPTSQAVVLPTEIAGPGFISAIPPGRSDPRGLKPTFLQSLNGTLRSRSGQALDDVPYPRPMDEASSQPSMPLLLDTAAGSPPQVGTVATSAVASLVALAAGSRAVALSASNSNEVPGVTLLNNSVASNGPANSLVPTDPNPKSSGVPCAIAQASDDAHSTSNVPVQLHAIPALFSTVAAPPVPVSPAQALSEGQVHSSVPTGVPTVVPDQSPTMQSPSAPAGFFTSAPPAPAAPLAQVAPSSLPGPPDQTASSSADNPSPAPHSNPTFDIFSMMPVASAPAAMPTLGLQSPVNDNKVAPPLPEPPSAKPLAAAKSSDAKVIDPTPENPAAEPISTSRLTTANTVPALPVNATTVADQTASAPEGGFAVANTLISDTSNNKPVLLTSSLSPNSTAA